MKELLNPRVWRLIVVELLYTRLALNICLIFAAVTILCVVMVATPERTDARGFDGFDGIVVGMVMSLAVSSVHIFLDPYRQEGRFRQHLLLPLTRRQILFMRLTIPVLLLLISLVWTSVLVFIAGYRDWLLSGSRLMLWFGGVLGCLGQIYFLARDQRLTGRASQPTIVVIAALAVSVGLILLSIWAAQWTGVPLLLFSVATYLLLPIAVGFNLRWLSRPGDAI